MEFFLLDMDVSNVGVGVVFFQVYDGEERVIVYYSYVFSRFECNYCIIRCEFLVVVRVIENFYFYFYGRLFIVRIDYVLL